MKTVLILYCLLLLFGSSRTLGQADNDSLGSPNPPSEYKFHLNFSPEENFGLVLGVRSGIPARDTMRQIYELGLCVSTRTQGGEGGYVLRYLSLEIDNIKHQTFYGINAGIEGRDFMNIGLSIDYLTNFSGKRTFSIRPYMGVMFYPIRSLYCDIGCDISFVKPNFDMLNHWSIGVRYNVGLLEKNTAPGGDNNDTKK